MSRAQRLTVVLALNLTLVTGLVAVGAAAHSLAVLAEGGDYLLLVAASAADRLLTRTPQVDGPAGDVRPRRPPGCLSASAGREAG